MKNKFLNVKNTIQNGISKIREKEKESNTTKIMGISIFTIILLLIYKSRMSRIKKYNKKSTNIKENYETIDNTLKSINYGNKKIIKKRKNTSRCNKKICLIKKRKNTPRCNKKTCLINKHKNEEESINNIVDKVKNEFVIENKLFCKELIKHLKSFSLLQENGLIKSTRAITFLIKQNFSIAEIQKSYRLYGLYLDDDLNIENFIKIMYSKPLFFCSNKCKKSVRNLYY